MNEWRRIERLARKALARREPAVVAHLVDVEGSHFRRPGARLVMTGERRVGGHDLRGMSRSGPAAPDAGSPRGARRSSVVYDTGTPGDALWGTGLGCGGRLEILLSALAGPRADTRSRRPGRRSGLVRNGRSGRGRDGQTWRAIRGGAA